MVPGPQARGDTVTLTGAAGADGLAPDQGGGAGVTVVLDNQANAASGTAVQIATGGAGGAGTGTGTGGAGGDATAMSQQLNGVLGGNSLGDANRSNVATGGAGGSGGAAGGGGVGGDATAMVDVAGTGPARLVVSGTATAGAGGSVWYAGGTGPGGAGGAAQSHVTATLVGGSLLSSTATARAGGGGASYGGVAADGGGGTNMATASADLSSTPGQYAEVTAKAEARGGAGGETGTGLAGNGGSVALDNAVSGTSLHTLRLLQQAIGGAGGSAAAGGRPGAGGDATSRLVVRDASSSYLLDVGTSAEGGAAGWSPTGYAEAGHALAITDIGSALNGAKVRAQATAIGGRQGQGNSYSDAVYSGSAYAEARASSVGVGSSARAVAGFAGPGTARASAVTDGGAFGKVTASARMSSVASEYHYSVAATTAMGAQPSDPMGAQIVLAPSLDTLQTMLSVGTDAALDDRSASVDAIGRFDWSLDTGRRDGVPVEQELAVGLAKSYGSASEILLALYYPSFQTSWPTASSVFSSSFAVIANGRVLLEQSFTSAVDAQSWFTNRLVDLGSVIGDLALTLRYVVSGTDINAMSAFAFAIASTTDPAFVDLSRPIAPVPGPIATAGLPSLAALLFLGMRHRRRPNAVT